MSNSQPWTLKLFSSEKRTFLQSAPLKLLCLLATPSPFLDVLHTIAWVKNPLWAHLYHVCLLRFFTECRKSAWRRSSFATMATIVIVKPMVIVTHAIIPILKLFLGLHFTKLDIPLSMLILIRSSTLQDQKCPRGASPPTESDHF